MIEIETITIKEATEIAGGDEQLFQEMLDKIRHWLQQQPHLPQGISDKRLQITLLTSKLDLEKSKKRIDLLYTLRTLLPEVFADYDPLCDSIAQLHKCMQWVPLPKLSPEKHRIHVVRWINNDSSLFHLQDLLKYTFMMLDVRVDEDVISSECVIWDCANATFGHVLKFPPSLLKKCDLCLEAYGLRFKAIYFINAPTYIDNLLAMIKMFMKPKLHERIKIIKSGADSLYNIVPKSILPEDYGGEEPSMATLTDMWRTKVKDRRAWLLEQEKLKINESLRTECVINMDNLFGVAGTFRKLEID
ncbi:PREDICTED: alpha-tocopherol transfer protein-like [Dinoponera quadriceps]|uniref:Alpha-tocopherol transfer protein-like n=1 Tax=Dinoponera quadriceps TaxID=609295 RepID=A0A6P3XBL7_DINQU|nr:PREDICTED: alpha-tocopherol transfer protein-like [Dinoponera quadriceps]